MDELLLQAVVDLDWAPGTPRLEVCRSGPWMTVVSPDTRQKYVIPRGGGYNVPVPDTDGWALCHLSGPELESVVESFRGRVVTLDDFYRASVERGHARHRYYESWVRARELILEQEQEPEPETDKEEILGYLARAAVPRYTARFFPEQWIGDTVHEAEPLGPDQWDVTDYLDMLEKTGQDSTRWMALQGDCEESDALQFTNGAPGWVREWDGPFEIVVSEKRGR